MTVVAGLLADTVSGNPPPTVFVVTLWTLTVLMLGGAAAAVLLSLRLRKVARGLPEGQPRSGKQSQAGCLLIVAVPAVLLGLFLLDWAIGIM